MYEHPLAVSKSLRLWCESAGIKGSVWFVVFDFVLALSTAVTVFGHMLLPYMAASLTPALQSTMFTKFSSSLPRPCL